MSLSTIQIWQALQDAEIASTSECRQWASEILAASGNAALDHPQGLLTELVKLGRLTPFQANTLLNDSGQPLKIGRHRLLAPLSTPALGDWFEAIDMSSSTASWLYAISESRLKAPGVDRHPPSLKLARQHAAIKSPGLQSFSPPAWVDGYLWIAATPAEGRPLRETLKSLGKQTLSLSASIKLIRKVSLALAALHRAGIVHGRIGIDQVYWDGNDDITLLRDPFFPPCSPLGPAAPTALGFDDDRDHRIRYAAPEFTAPGQSPTFATDIYALGCMWWELLVGRPPFADSMLDEVPKMVCTVPLVVPRDIGLTPGQRKCLDYMLAKNPSARFANGDQLMIAWQAIDAREPETSPSAPPSPVPKPSVPQPLAPKPSIPQPTAPQPSAPQPSAPQPTVPQPPVSQPSGLQSRDPVRAESPSQLAPAQPVLPVRPAPPIPPVLEDREQRVIKPSNDSAKAGAARTGARRPSKKKARPIWLIPAMLGICIAVLGGLVLLLTWTGSDAPSPKTAGVEPKIADVNVAQKVPKAIDDAATGPATHVRVVDPIEDQYMIAKGDDTVPWVPPRASQPYSLAMLPPGAQGFIFIRPEAWLSTPSGQAIIQSLTTSIDTLWKPIEKACGLPLESIEELAIALYGGRSDGWPVMVYRIQLASATSFAKLQERLPGAIEQVVSDQRTILVSGDQAFYLNSTPSSSESQQQYMSIGPVELVRELVDMDGGAPLRRQMEQLWQVTDAQSDLSLLLNTGFFFSDARNVLPSISPRIQSLGKEMFDEKTQAILVTTSIEPQWYGELRAIGQNGDDAARFTKDLQSRMKSAADAMESELVASPASPYWRAIAVRFPQMLRSLVRYQRFGVENNQSVTNFYLPTIGSANIVIATWMSLQMPSGAATSSTNVAQAAATKKLSGDDLLSHPVSINFEQEPLDSALALIAEEVNRSLPAGSGPIALSIDGKSFELASVTRNQQVRDFRFKDQPLRNLLTDLTARVNPDRTVKSLDEVKQAVIWILSETEGKSNIIFTTRRGIEGTDHKIPKEFTKATSP